MDKEQWQSKSPKGVNPPGYHAEYHQNGWKYEPVSYTPAYKTSSCVRVALFWIIMITLFVLTVAASINPSMLF